MDSQSDSTRLRFPSTVPAMTVDKKSGFEAASTGVGGMSGKSLWAAQIGSVISSRRVARSTGTHTHHTCRFSHLRHLAPQVSMIDSQ